MYALEPEPEQKNRWKRMGIGAGVAVGLAGGLLLTARFVEPARRLLPDVVEMAIADEPPPPPPKALPPQPPPPPPPPPRNAPEPKEKPVEQEAEQEKAEAEPQSGEPQVGLDANSFADGAGGSGLGFRQGTTQMGDPNVPVRRVEKPVGGAERAKQSPARALNPQMPRYPAKARKLNIEGDVLVEAEIDDRGRPREVRVKQGLAPELDEAALSAVKRWRFQPATVEGRAVPSTHVIRIRFKLV